MTNNPNVPRSARGKRAPTPPPARSDQPIDPADLTHPALYINRELGWLAFNRRVLNQASNRANPLLERLKFLAITGANLDEFFMIRVATTLKKLRAGIQETSPDSHSVASQLKAMRDGAYDMLREQTATWATLGPELEAQGITLLDTSAWTPAIADYLSGFFAREVYPALTPLAFDRGHPFPFISNLSTNLAVMVIHGGQTKFARVKIPAVLPRFVRVPPEVDEANRSAFVFLEDVIKANVQALFPETTVEGAYLFRVVRDSDLAIDEDDDADDLLETVDRSLKQLRHGAVALLQVEAQMPAQIVSILVDNFEAIDEVVLRTPDRLGFAGWMELAAIQRPDLKFAPFSAPSLWRDDEDPEVIFGMLRDRDVVLHHPFESFDSVETFLRAAVRDPRVLAIKMTLYRIGAHSPLIPLLIEAAERGTQVVVLVELKARFDERNNILWARRLESHGIHVSYGFAALKTHAKLCLVVRQEADGVQRYVHTGSGNYNPGTARVYTDVGLLTADPDIVADASSVFNLLTGYSSQTEYRTLVVAPAGLRQRLETLISQEMDHACAGRPARLIFKVNALTDDRIIRLLYRASQAGLEIDLLVRGACCLRPGLPGISERIRVRTMVGRFLEHSRLYWFQNGGDELLYVSSADLMERNLDRRVELLCPIGDPAARAHLRRVVLDAYLRDTEQALELDATGAYRPPASRERFDAQAFLLKHYSDRRPT